MLLRFVLFGQILGTLGTEIFSMKFTIKKVTHSGLVRYKVDIPATVAGRRKRKFFKTLESAQVFAADKRAEVRNVGREAFQPSTSLKDCVAAFLPRLDSKSKAHRVNAASVYDALLRDLGSRPIASISPAMIDARLQLRTNETTRARDFRYLRLLFRWAYRMEYIERNPISRVESPRAKSKSTILTVEEMRTLLNKEMPEWLLACICLSGFAGIRTEELMRMDWADVDWQAGEIHVRPGVQKDSGGWTQRYVTILPALARRKVDLKGPLVPTYRRAYFDARRKLGIPPNALRHSFASYHLALCGDAGKTAHQMGHTSPAMVYRIYARAVRKADAENWWNL
jgi:integrase